MNSWYISCSDRNYLGSHVSNEMLIGVAMPFEIFSIPLCERFVKSQETSSHNLFSHLRFVLPQPFQCTLIHSWGLSVVFLILKVQRHIT